MSFICLAFLNHLADSIETENWSSRIHTSYLCERKNNQTNNTNKQWKNKNLLVQHSNGISGFDLIKTKG